MSPMSDKLHTGVPCWYHRRVQQQLRATPVPKTPPLPWCEQPPPGTAATDLHHLRHMPKRHPPCSHKSQKSMQSTAGCTDTSPPSLGTTAFMFWWRVYSRLRIKILGTVAIWNCQIALDFFPFDFFPQKIMGISVCHTDRLHSSTKGWQFPSTGKAWCSLANTFTVSLLPHHRVLLTGCRAKAELWFISRRVSRNSWLSWTGSHCCEASTPLLLTRVWLPGCDSQGSQEGSVHNFPFCRRLFKCKILVPFCVLFKASLLTLLHSVVSDPLHPTEGFRSQIFRAKDWAKQSQTPKSRVRMCFARKQQCSETMFSKGLGAFKGCSAFPCFLPFCSWCPGMDTWDLEEGKAESALLISFRYNFLQCMFHVTFTSVTKLKKCHH